MKVPIELLSIEDDGFHIFLLGQIHGKPSRLLIDTGASRTVFDKERIRGFITDDHVVEDIDKLSTGLGTNSMESQTILLDDFVLGNNIMIDYRAVILNLEHVNQSYISLGYPAIDGVLGGDLLHLLKAKIDYSSGTISLGKAVRSPKRPRSR